MSTALPTATLGVFSPPNLKPPPWNAWKKKLSAKTSILSRMHNHPSLPDALSSIFTLVLFHPSLPHCPIIQFYLPSQLYSLESSLATWELDPPLAPNSPGWTSSAPDSLAFLQKFLITDYRILPKVIKTEVRWSRHSNSFQQKDRKSSLNEPKRVVRFAQIVCKYIIMLCPYIRQYICYAHIRQ